MTLLRPVPAQRFPSVLRRAPFGRSSGFTLIEVLVALVVVTAALTIIAQGFLTGGRASVGAQHGTFAALLADGKMAEVEAGILSVSSGTSGSFDPEYPDFKWSMTPETTDIIGLSKVTVTVTWEERGQERMFVLTRLFKEPPARE